MDTLAAREEIARFLASQDAPTLAQVLLELAEDHEPVYQRLVRLRLRDDPTGLRAQFTVQLQRWETDDRFVRYHDAAAFGRELDVWIAQVQREVLPRFPREARALSHSTVVQYLPELSATGSGQSVAAISSGEFTTSNPRELSPKIGFRMIG